MAPRRTAGEGAAAALMRGFDGFLATFVSRSRTLARAPHHTRRDFGASLRGAALAPVVDASKDVPRT
jgi:hypothetical protein